MRSTPASPDSEETAEERTRPGTTVCLRGFAAGTGAAELRSHVGASWPEAGKSN